MKQIENDFDFRRGKNSSLCSSLFLRSGGFPQTACYVTSNYYHMEPMPYTYDTSHRFYNERLIKTLALIVTIAGMPFPDLQK